MTIEKQLIESAGSLFGDEVSMKICLAMSSGQDDKYWSIEWYDRGEAYNTKEYFRLNSAMKEYKRILALPVKDWAQYKQK